MAVRQRMKTPDKSSSKVKISSSDLKKKLSSGALDENKRDIEIIYNLGI